MKIPLFLISAILLLGLANFEPEQKKYLPIYINFYDSTSIFHTEILLNLKAAFQVRKIMTISKKDAEAYIYNEAYAVTESYYKNGGDLNDMAKKRAYQSANMKPVANSLLVSIRLNKNGILADTVKWDNYPIPINFENFPKTKWRYMILDSNNARTMLQMSQSIVDSIIASNVLVKE